MKPMQPGAVGTLIMILGAIALPVSLFIASAADTDATTYGALLAALGFGGMILGGYVIKLLEQAVYELRVANQARTKPAASKTTSAKPRKTPPAK